MLERIFKLRQNGTCVKTEILSLIADTVFRKINQKLSKSYYIKSHFYTSKSYLVTSTSTVPSQEKLMDLASRGV